MTVHKGETFDKRVEFKALDGDRRVAIGGVMVPNKVDLQGDFIEPELIESFSDGFMQRLQSTDGEAMPGVMHAVFPESHVSLAENRVLDEAREVGGKEFPAGSWIQGWKFEDDELWSLVQDEVLSGYSIGASGVEWSESMTQDELPDGVTVADAYPDDEPVWQILDGEVGEVSSVDLPAVPDAVMVAAKAGGEKSILDHVGGKNEFVAVMEDRGATEDDAERLWHYLQRALGETDGKAAPKPSDSTLTRWGRSMWQTITGGESGSKTAPTDGGTEKDGQTLSRRNQDAIFASIDAQIAVLDDAGVNHGMVRFTDRPDIEFDIAEYTGKAAPADKDAPGGDTPDDDTTTMSDDDPMADAPEWGKALYDQTEKNSDRIDTLADKVSADPDDPEKAWEDAPAWAKALRDEQEKNREDITDLAEASGKSQQLSGDSKESNDESNRSKADVLGLPGGEH